MSNDQKKQDTKKTESARYVFVRDDGKSVTGFGTHEGAKAAAAEIPETETQRVRVRLRSRTNLWDVVVKTRREVKP